MSALDSKSKTQILSKDNIEKLKAKIVMTPQPHRDNMRLKFFDIFSKVEFVSMALKNEGIDVKKLLKHIPVVCGKLEKALFKAYPTDNRAYA